VRGTTSKHSLSLSPTALELAARLTHKRTAAQQTAAASDTAVLCAVLCCWPAGRSTTGGPAVTCLAGWLCTTMLMAVHINLLQSMAASAAAVPQTQEQGRAIVAGGWDPGLSHRLAAGAFPHSPHYFESCPDSPGPNHRCLGMLRPGSGFYTLGGGSTNQSCTINGGAQSRWTPNSQVGDYM
jgi:hypothetical protein